MEEPGAHDEIIANFLIITGCKNDEKALQYLQMSNYQLETAVSLFMELENQQQQFSPPKQVQQPQQQRSRPQNIQQPPETSQINQNLMEQYRKYKEQHEEVGVIKKMWNFSVGTVTSIFSRQPNYGEDFQKYLQEKKIKIDIRFQMGTFKENIARAQAEIKPLLVYIHDVQKLQIANKMFQHKNFVSLVNKNYYNYGMLANAETLAQLPQEVEIPCIVIYRVNFIDQVLMMNNYLLDEQTDFDQLTEQVKRLKGQFNKIYMQEEQAKKQVNEPEHFNPHSQNQFRQYQQQQESVEKQKQQQREREFLRQEQEAAYRQAEQQAKEKEKQQEEKIKLEQKKLQEEQQKEEQRQMIKAQLLSNLPEEPQNDGICIQFRFSEELRKRKFNTSDKIQTLFDFVLCQEDNCFINSKAEIDLIQNFPRLSLKDKKDQTIGDVFIESTGEQLIVEELE